MSAPVQSIQEFEFDACRLEGDKGIDVGIAHQVEDFFRGEIGFDLNMGVFGGGVLQHLRGVGAGHNARLRQQWKNFFHQVNGGPIVFRDGEVAVVEYVIAFAGERHHFGV